MTTPLLRPLMLATAVSSVVLTLLFGLSDMGFAYRAPQAHVVIETVAGLIALLVGFIVFGRFLLANRLSDLVLGSALALMGSSALFFVVIPAAAAADSGPWSTWAPLIARLIGAIGIAAASLIGDRRVSRPRPLAVRAGILCLATVVAIGTVVAVLAPDLPLGVDPGLSPQNDSTRVVGHPTVLAILLAEAIFYAVAAIGFMRSAERTGDSLSGWLAVAAVLQSAAHVNFFLFPSLYSDWVYTGDFLRLAFWLVLLAGIAYQIRRYQFGLTEAAALEERRRLARELHDGLAQELAFIATQTRWLSRRREETKGLDALATAAERALDESRSAISALTRPLDEPLDVAVAQAAEEIAGRVGVRLKLSLEEGIDVPVSTREALVRIVREAVNNTARHGEAKLVTIQLTRDDGIRLRVGDDGIGFDPADQNGRGFGLTSMKERARALGGELHVASSPGAGTAVEVVVP